MSYPILVQILIAWVGTTKNPLSIGQIIRLINDISFS